MSRIYNNNWNAKKLTINFNQKQWRQDLAAYVNEHLYWNGRVRVTRSKAIEKNSSIYFKGRRQFEIFNDSGGRVFVQYENENEIISTSHSDLINNYFKERSFK